MKLRINIKIKKYKKYIILLLLLSSLFSSLLVASEGYIKNLHMTKYGKHIIYAGILDRDVTIDSYPLKKGTYVSINNGKLTGMRVSSQKINGLMLKQGTFVSLQNRVICSATLAYPQQVHGMKLKGEFSLYKKKCIQLASATLSEDTFIDDIKYLKDTKIRFNYYHKKIEEGILAEETKINDKVFKAHSLIKFRHFPIVQLGTLANKSKIKGQLFDAGKYWFNKDGSIYTPYTKVWKP